MFKIFFIIAMIAGYFSKNKKYIALIFPILFTLFIFFGYKDYVSLIRGFGSTQIKQLPNIFLYDSQMQKVDLTQKDKIYVLDFWATSCAVCIREFSDFEKVVLKYKNNPNLLFYSVNIPTRKETIANNIAISTEKYHYKFNKLFAQNRSVFDSLSLRGFPTLILMKNEKIYYQGSLIMDEDIKVHHIETEIKRVLELKK